MTTQLAQYQKALRAIGDQRLNSLTENVAPRRTLDDVWPDSIAYMLKQAGWKFALRYAELTVNVDITPAWGTRVPFAQPDDYAGRLTNIASDPDFLNELIGFEEHDGQWWTGGQYQFLYVSYVSNAVDKGLNLGAWPVDFANAHALYMAWESGLQITKSGTTRQSLFQDYEIAINRSKGLDAINNSVKRKPQGSWVRSRFAGGFVGRNNRE